MNNDQFRRLMSADNNQRGDGSQTPRAGATPSALGAKRTSLVPMTPRTVRGSAGVDFARQVRERNAAQQPTKKFKTAAPKGSKFAAGYTDRARARAEAEEKKDEAAEKGKRITALEEQMKLGQISVETFEALRDQITGGDVGSTHLVKGLDRKLLERVRRGEDVLGTGSQVEPTPDVDEELDKLEEVQVEAVKREQSEKKGTMAPPSLAGKKRSRDEIMAELKAQRKAAAEARAAAEPKLNDRWKKVGEKGKSRIEIDHKGREVLITVDEDGMVKKKVRKVQAKDNEPDKSAMELPDVQKAVLGADVSVPIIEADKPAPLPAVDDDDIFSDAGTDYNPLGNPENDDEDDDSSDEDDNDPSARNTSKSRDTSKPIPAPKADGSQATETEQPKAPRNYFKDKSAVTEEPEKDRLAGVQDFLKKAAKLDSLRSGEDDGEGDEDRQAREAQLKKRAQMLANQDRDLEDMDMGFGGSRMVDAEEEEGEKKMKLSEWKGNADDGWEEKESKGDGKKKRKPKKRKGDANNMTDIMRVIEGRKGGGSK